MQPWKISAGLTAAIAGSAILLAGPRLEYLAPYWPLLLAEHGVLLALHLALALAAVAGRHLRRRTRRRARRPRASRVDLAERSVRRGEGDPALTDALRRDAEGDWE